MGPKRPVAPCQMEILLEVDNFPFNQKDQYLEITSAIAVVNGTHSITRGILQVDSTLAGVYYEGASVASVDGVTQSAIPVGTLFTLYEEANPFGNLVTGYFNTLYQNNWGVRQTVFSFQKGNSIVAYTTIGAGQYPNEDIIIVSIKVISKCIF